ncbi:hypothetical protein DE146DRAFT_636771 [Phaeosphaeria sp. MPI-PUGE-AT-0046c]|nr:hypothetical protein DE146DRAFT_636771 [Phaeosphaeria sp. MPI-PUGE-AT-0046c]
MTESQNQEGEKLGQEPGLQPGRNTGPSRSQNTFTNVHVGDDSRQLIVSTTGMAIHATDVSTGARTTHTMGQMSDDTIRHLYPPVSRRTAEQNIRGMQRENASWQEQYGEGHNIP